MELKDYIDHLKSIDAPMQSVYYWFKEEIEKLLLETYDQEQNPYGAAWSPRKAFYPWPILHKSGHMRGSFKTRISGDTYTLSNEAAYARFHQKGTAKMDIRQILPEDELPARWQEVLEDYFLQKLQQYFEEGY